MKHVVITGSTRGIGWGLAKRFIEAECKVTVNGRSPTSVDAAVRKLKAAYPTAQVQGYAADVTCYQEVEALKDKAVESFGNIHIWINNAGIDQERKKAWELDSDTFAEMLKINLLGIFNGCKVALNHMIGQGEGQIFNMEGFGSDGMMRDKMTLYGTTKRALRYFTQSLAREAEGTPVLIGTLSPGMVVTDFLLKSAERNTESGEKNRKIFNILADDVDTVAAFLSRKILANKENNAHIVWLTRRKVLWRFASAGFTRRNVFK